MPIHIDSITFPVVRTGVVLRTTRNLDVLDLMSFMLFFGEGPTDRYQVRYALDPNGEYIVKVGESAFGFPRIARWNEKIGWYDRSLPCCLLPRNWHQKRVSRTVLPYDEPNERSV